jgi:hypothetical protein
MSLYQRYFRAYMRVTICYSHHLGLHLNSNFLFWIRTCVRLHLHVFVNDCLPACLLVLVFACVFVQVRGQVITALWEEIVLSTATTAAVVPQAMPTAAASSTSSLCLTHVCMIKH